VIARLALALALAGGLAGLAACDGDDAASATTAPLPPGVTPTPSPESPFCVGMGAIFERIENDPPADLAAYVAGAYRELLAVTPAELTTDLEAMIAQLEAPASAAPTTAPTAGTAVESVPDNVLPTVIVVSPGERVADYVDQVCNRVGANPGPPATQPADPFE